MREVARWLATWRPHTERERRAFMHTDLRDLRLSRKDFRTIQHQLATPRPCLLCGTYPTAFQAIFTPDKAELWEGKSGQVRLLGYALCRRCKALPDLTLHVEARLQAYVVGRKN